VARQATTGADAALTLAAVGEPSSVNEKVKVEIVEPAFAALPSWNARAVDLLDVPSFDVAATARSP
jgi:hypothetical protein